MIKRRFSKRVVTLVNTETTNGMFQSVMIFVNSSGRSNKKTVLHFINDLQKIEYFIVKDYRSGILNTINIRSIDLLRSGQEPSD